MHRHTAQRKGGPGPPGCRFPRTIKKKNYPCCYGHRCLYAASLLRPQSERATASVYLYTPSYRPKRASYHYQKKRARQAELICSCSCHRMGEQENNKSASGGNSMAVDAPAKENGRAADPRLQGISDAIRVVPHFPKPGIMFNDITELLLRPGVFKDAVDMFVERYRGMRIAAVAGIEARGFIFGPAIALAIGAKFIPLRKPKKLPERAGADVVECACLIGLPKFKDFYKLNGKPVYILVESRK